MNTSIILNRLFIERGMAELIIGDTYAACMIYLNFWSSVHKCIQDNPPKPKAHYLLDKKF